MLFGKLDCASEWQKLNVFELNVLRGLVFAFPRSELRDQAISNVSIVVHDEDVPHANPFVVEQRLAELADDFVQVLVALQALVTECDAGHDCLFLFDDHTCVCAYGPQVEVILDSESEAEHQGQQQEQPGPEASNLGRKSHFGN